MSIIEEISLLKERISRLKEKDKHFRVYGSKSHKYQFRPTLTEDEVSVFEQKYQIKLPEDYRLFLIQIGNGGAGPDYGLSPLEIIHPDDAKPNIPFRWSGDEGIKDAEFMKFYDERPGVIELVSYGYETDFLVVNGDSYGTIWTEYPQWLSPTGKTFIENYKDWLETKLKYLVIDAEIDSKIDEIKEGMSKSNVVNILGGERELLYEKRF